MAVRRGLRQDTNNSRRERVGKMNSNKKLLGAKSIATRNKDATRGSWPYY